MKADLALDLIKRLTLDRRPVGTESKGTLIFEGNPDGKDYIVWDSSGGIGGGMARQTEEGPIFKPPAVRNGNMGKRALGPVFL